MQKRRPLNAALLARKKKDGSRDGFLVLTFGKKVVLTDDKGSQVHSKGWRKEDAALEEALQIAELERAHLQDERGPFVHSPAFVKIAPLVVVKIWISQVFWSLMRQISKPEHPIDLLYWRNWFVGMGPHGWVPMGVQQRTS